MNTAIGLHTFIPKPELPEILPLTEDMVSIHAHTPNRRVIKGLEEGQKFCFRGTWGTAMAFYSWLKNMVAQRQPAISYISWRRQRKNLNALTKNLFISIVHHHPDLEKAPGNPWIKEFFPNEKGFYLRFTDYLGLNGAQQWYEKGVQLPGLESKVHPFYGTYFPTRHEHLGLFDDWLKGQQNIKKAIDMGTGCGAITFYLLKHAVHTILATDINPNALFSVCNDLQKEYGITPERAETRKENSSEVLFNYRNQADQKNHLSPKKTSGSISNIKLIYTSFFSGIEKFQPDLVVFNPPWIPAEKHTTIDKAMYYDEDFFSTFFSGAFEFLNPGSKLAILFSDFAQVAGLTNNHPIERELSTHNRFQLMEKHEASVHQPPSGNKNWLADIRLREKTQLWVLGRKG